MVGAGLGTSASGCSFLVVLCFEPILYFPAMNPNLEAPMRKLLLLIPLLLVCTGVLHAQTAEQGAVLGVVTDQSGAVIPGAKVTVSNLDTGFKKEDTTDASGNFQILALPIGPYSVEVSMTGFKSWKVDRLVLEIGQRSRLSPVLTLGGVNQVVQVAGIESQMQTESASTETVIQEKQVTDLPLNGRNVVQLVSLAPGMQYSGQQSGQFGAERGSFVQGVGCRAGRRSSLWTAPTQTARWMKARPRFPAWTPSRNSMCRHRTSAPRTGVIRCR